MKDLLWLTVQSTVHLCQEAMTAGAGDSWLETTAGWSASMVRKREQQTPASAQSPVSTQAKLTVRECCHPQRIFLPQLINQDSPLQAHPGA